MYQNILNPLMACPAPYESTGLPFWDDPHIAASMLAAHLASDSDGASRTHAFIERSVDWIASLIEQRGKALLDLGCGPGLYAERFHKKGFRVTGIDLSLSSIDYAKRSAEAKGMEIIYHNQDYLTMEYENAFDIVVLIYCDFGVLPPGSRASLLRKIYRALRPDGLFILDAFTRNNYSDFEDKLEASYESAGFWCMEPYLNLKRSKAYHGSVYLEQYTIVMQSDCRTYNLWNHAFDRDELTENLMQAGFATVGFYGDMAGAAYSGGGGTLCAVGRKP